MRLTANYGWPVGESADARRDFPDVVDGPRSDGIDTELARADAELAGFGTLGNRMLAGVDVTSAGGVFTLTLPADTFTSMPFVVATSIQQNAIMVVAGASTATSIVFWSQNSSGGQKGDVYFNWIIIGRRGSAGHPGPVVLPMVP